MQNKIVIRSFDGTTILYAYQLRLLYLSSTIIIIIITNE